MEARTVIQYDGASFKDPGGRVFVRDGRVFRALSAAGRAGFDALSRSGAYESLVADGLLVPAVRRATAALGLPAEEVGAEVIEHERIPFITYPYEWSFEMLRDAALLTLTVIERALAHDFILKDATPFNVQFRRGKPVLIDVLSFEPYRDGAPWVGYSQFCSMFLYPLMLTAYRQVEFQPWLRGTLGTLRAADMRRLLGWGAALRRGVLLRVHVAAWLQRSFEEASVDIPRKFAEAKFSQAAIRRNVDGLRRVLATMSYAPSQSAWARYASENTYGDADARAKRALVDEALARCRPGWAWDLGCNIGLYAERAARAGAQVVAIDSDAACIDVLYRAQKAGERSREIQGLIGDVTNPSPAMGWKLAERTAWQDRGRADFVIALALVHHLAISANIPIAEFARYLRALAPAGVTEFVSKEDPQVGRLLARRRDVFDDYALAPFEAALRRHFAIVKRQVSSTGTRVLFELAPGP